MRKYTTIYMCASAHSYIYVHINLVALEQVHLFSFCKCLFVNKCLTSCISGIFTYIETCIHTLIHMHARIYSSP